MRARRDFSPLVDVREFILVENCHPTRERDRNLFAIGMNKIRIIEISNTKLKRKAQSVSLRILASVAKKKVLLWSAFVAVEEEKKAAKPLKLFSFCSSLSPVL
jgi:hypothetical protein